MIEILVPLGGAISVFDIVDIGKRNAGGGDLAEMLRYISIRHLDVCGLFIDNHLTGLRIGHVGTR